MGWPGPSPKYKKIKKSKIRVSINKKNKYEFIGLFTDARVRNKNTGLNLYYFYSLYFILFS
jgi:hypothetical protein